MRDAAKRATDLVAAALGLLLLAPVLLAAALAVRFGSPGPVLYRGLRVGRYGRPFRILKFRTMTPDAERLGGSATGADDPRVTATGRFLRRCKLDELPQLINVLRGEMSLVGPRPEVPWIVAAYSEQQRRVLDVRPGITDWASLWDIDEAAALGRAPDPEQAYRDFILPVKLGLQLDYVSNRSWSGDMRILLSTLRRLLRRTWVPKEIAGLAPPQCHQR
jgi:lipopolysaccharide/colanic/teichoic acid biosynthesis glycosyltransferase